MKRTLGRSLSPKAQAQGASGGAPAGSARAAALERERRRRCTAAWAVGALVVVGLHLFAGRQVLAFLSASCTAEAETAIAAATAQLGFDGGNGTEAEGEAGAQGRLGAEAAEPSSSSGNSSLPNIFFYRIIGNNMPPLQCPSQLLWNTQYALAYEGELPGCTKRWVINKIVNATERALLIDSLLEAGFSMDDIIIRWFNATKVAMQPKERWLDVVTQQNEARNLAIEDGIKSGARWIMPFDGNHFMTRESWATIQHSARKAEERDFKYFKVPVHRLYKIQDPTWVNAGSHFTNIKKHAPLMIESQLVFRNDAPGRFQHGMVYGMQNKLETLARVCGDREDPKFVQNCWCDDLGKEGQLHPSSNRIAKECGYSLRLWFYPCNGTDAAKVFKNGMYRKKMRSDSRRQMYAWVKKEAQAALKQMQVQQDLKAQQRQLLKG